MAAGGLGSPASRPHLAARAALVTRAHKREVDRDALGAAWREQAASLGFSAEEVVETARRRRSIGVDAPERMAEAKRDRDAAGKGNLEPSGGGSRQPARDAAQAVSWAVAHLSEREAVFSRSDLLAATLAWKPGAVTVESANGAIDAARREGGLHDARAYRGVPPHLGGEGTDHRHRHRRRARDRRPHAQRAGKGRGVDAPPARCGSTCTTGPSRTARNRRSRPSSHRRTGSWASRATPAPARPPC